ncbi:hypothetical protein D3C73_1635890 [compost metagenome]
MGSTVRRTMVMTTNMIISPTPRNIFPVAKLKMAQGTSAEPTPTIGIISTTTTRSATASG